MPPPKHTLLLLLTLLALATAAPPTNDVVVDNDLSTAAPPTNDAVVGIDLGTTFSCVAAYNTERGVVEIIPNAFGQRVMPSFVYFDPETGAMLVGESAKNMLVDHPRDTLFDVKRLMGRRYTDAPVQRDLSMFPFRVSQSADNRPLLVAQGVNRTFAPEEVSALILKELKQTAEKYLGTNVTRAVVTVPAYFNDAQRQATKDAGLLAGLHVMRIINEPTAAAIAYGIDESKSHNIAVFDLGGGTFDISVLNIQAEDGVFEVVSTNGNTRLGGEDMDHRIVLYVLGRMRLDLGDAFPRNDTMEFATLAQRLKIEAERAKIRLSSHMLAEVHVESGGRSHKYAVTRAMFEELTKDLLDSTMPPMKRALGDARLKPADIDEIVLNGGSTHIPRVRAILSDFFGGRPMRHTINPDEAVAMGAAIQAHILGGGKVKRDIVLLDVTPLTLGVSLKGGIMRVLIKRNTPLPVRMSRPFTTTRDGQDSVTIKVFEGERPLARHNNHLNTFRLEVPPAPRGIVKVAVSFDVDVNGLLDVTAKEQSTGASRTVRIEGSGGRMGSSEIERKLADSRKYEHADAVISQHLETKSAVERHAVQVLRMSEGDVSGLLDRFPEKFADTKLNDDEREDLAEAANRALQAARKQSGVDTTYKWLYRAADKDEGDEGRRAKRVERSIKAELKELDAVDVELIDTVKQVYALAYHRLHEVGAGRDEAADARVYSDDDGEAAAPVSGAYDAALDQAEEDAATPAPAEPWQNVKTEL